jgi:UDP-N-acetylmuramoylalanine--D-glutamate ligase
MDFRSRKITVMGLGRHGGGVAAARFCAQAGGIITVTDLADEAAISESLSTLQDVSIAKFILGKHQAVDFCTTDIVVVNPAVKPANSFVELARLAGAQITSEIELFLQICPAKVIGVTGTVGKSTTAAMLAMILKSAGRQIWLGGNIGNSLLSDVSRMRADDIVVLEMSSFQLHWLSDAAHWPKGAIITNCSPNHLDWHDAWKDYAATKRQLLSHLPSDGFAVLNNHDLEVSNWRTQCRGVVFDPYPLELIPPLHVPGRHNDINAACAAAAAKQLDIDEPSIFRGLSEFVGLPHRLRLVTEICDRRFYNDSKSTTPAAAMAALKSMEWPPWLLLGGADKQCDFVELIGMAVRQAKGAAVFGSMADKLQDLIAFADKYFPCFRCKNLSDALRWCWQQSKSGEAILLSPGCASTDQYRDFVHRGEEFERLVNGIDPKSAAGTATYSFLKH